MSTEYSEAAQAEAAIQTSHAYQTETGEAVLNALGVYIGILSTTGVNPFCLDSKALAVSESEAISTTGSVAASAAFDRVKYQVSQFAENSKILVAALDELGKVHPFIQSVPYFSLTSSVITHSLHHSGGFCVQSSNCP